MVAVVAPALLSVHAAGESSHRGRLRAPGAVEERDGGCGPRRGGAAAAARLAEPGCARIFSEFRDASGVTLQQRLDALGRSGSAQLQAIYFYDGANRRGCQGNGTLAVTEPGSVVVHVCPQFVLRQRQDPDQAPIALIHELLHTLGLGENPPSSEAITRHVRARCVVDPGY